jgi:drug/metabolite transporter (DMT)-like permease
MSWSLIMAALRMGTREWALLVFLSVLWGGAFFFAAIAVKQVEPFTLAFLRMGLAALALAVIAAVLDLKMPKSPEVWLGFLILGVIGTAAPFSLIYWGQTEINGGLASILNAATPLWTIVVAHFFTRDEKFTLRRFLGVLTGFAGVAIIMAPSVQVSWSDSPLLAEASILVAGLCYAVAGVFAKRFKEVPPVVLSCGQLAFGALFILPIVFVFDHPFSRPAPDIIAVAAILAIALLSTALAFIIYFEILRVAGATNVMLVTLLVPVSAIFLGALILGEALAPRHFAGLAFIACGLMLIDGRLLQYARRKMGGDEPRDASGLKPPRMLNDAQNL